MPVGQAVTATSERRAPGAAGAAGGAGGRRGGGVRRPAVGRGRGRGCRARTHDRADQRRRPPRAWSRSRRPSVKSFLTSARASLVSSCRWVASPPAGRGDQEGQVGRAVLGAEVDRRAEPGEGQRRLRRPRARCGSAGSRCRRAGRWRTSPRGRSRPRRAGRRRSARPALGDHAAPAPGSRRACRCRGRRRGAPRSVVIEVGHRSPLLWVEVEAA